ncbi:hypothetical protein GCM10025879_15290 [Leuconostoc litchii]|nr:hypothetical protein GCM10025879_15290 [Leuconostoc litchii]
MVGDTTETTNTAVRITTDNVAYQQIAKILVGNKGHVTLLSVIQQTKQQKKQLKKTELVLTDSHKSSLLTEIQRQHISPKMVIASDYIQASSTIKNYYLSPETTIVMAQQIVNHLSDMDPKNRDFYVESNKKFMNRINDLTTIYNNLKKKQNINYLSTDSTQNLLMSQLGYKQEANNIDKMTDKQLSDVENKLADKHIKFVLTNIHDNTENTKSLLSAAKEADIPVVTFTTFTPNNTKIWNWQLLQLKKIQKALDK